MKLADAPDPGWFPDPENRARLRWWDGTDWSDVRRAPPSDVELARAEANREPAAPDPSQLVQGFQQYPPGYSRQDSAQLIAEVRNAARAEVDRAADMFTQRAQTAIRGVTPLISQYTNRFIRLFKLALGVAIALVIFWIVFQAIASQSFFEWIGDRIDNLTDDESSLGLLTGIGRSA